MENEQVCELDAGFYLYFRPWHPLQEEPRSPLINRYNPTFMGKSHCGWLGNAPSELCSWLSSPQKTSERLYSSCFEGLAVIGYFFQMMTGPIPKMQK